MASQGTTTVDFGTGNTDVTIFVASPAITTGQLVEAWLSPTDNGSNTADDHLFVEMDVKAYGVVNGSGFSIYCYCRTGVTTGIYTLAWVYN